MTDYVRSIDFGAKDALATGNANKIVKGVDLNTEFNAVQTSSATKEDKANKGVASGYAGLNSSVGIDITGASTFAATVGITGILTINSSLKIIPNNNNPLILMSQNSGTTDNKDWGIQVSTEQFGMFLWNDSHSVSNTWLAVDRTGTTIDSVAFFGSVVTVNGVDVRSAAIISSGTMADARIAASNVTQHQASLSIACSQLTGTLADARVVASNVTQHQASLAISDDQVTSDVVTQTSSFSVSTTHQNAFVVCDSASAITITVGSNCLGAAGKCAVFDRRNTGTVTFSASGVTIRSRGSLLAINAQHGKVGLVQIDSTNYELSGDLG